MKRSPENITLLKYLKERSHLPYSEKKKIRLLYEEKDALHVEIFDIVSSIFTWYFKGHNKHKEVFEVPPEVFLLKKK